MDYDRSPASPIPAGLRGRCPRCGRGALFEGYLTPRPACEVCGLDYGFADAGDGPAFFVTSIVGLVVAALAMWVQFTWEPPFWVHALLWLPTVVLLTFAMMRPLKGAMIAIQYQQKAGEGRIGS